MMIFLDFMIILFFLLFFFKSANSRIDINEDRDREGQKAS